MAKKKPGQPKKETRDAAKKAIANSKKRGRKNAKPKVRSRRRTPGVAGRPPGKDLSDPKAPKDAPKGRKITNAEKTVRDTLIVERIALGWAWPEVAEEAGLSIDQTKRNYRARIKALPKLMEMDPMKIIDLLVQGFQGSVIDFEKMAIQYAERNPSAAVGAKKAAVETRKDIAHLLQTTGQLPHDLGTLRHLHDVRVTVQLFIEKVEEFVVRVESVELPTKKRAEVLAAAQELKGGLRSLAGGDPDEDPKAEAA